MAKYFYGVSVQGIQEYIFETNKLKEIIGASELIKKIEKFAEERFKNDRILINAAGNVKVVFDSKERAQEAIRDFVKKIRNEIAPGVTISEAMVEIKGDEPDKSEFFLLEKKLVEQRNKPEIPVDYRFSIIKTSSRTAKAAYGKDEDGKEIDYGTKLKLDAFKDLKNKESNIKTDLKYLKNKKGKIAIIHADGNSLGSIVPKIANNGKLKEFSKALDNATKKSYEDAERKFKNMNVRKVILGGDDMTCIIDADYALSFVNEYLKNFEKNTENLPGLREIGKKRLTACAGIAIVNYKYPVYYAVNLAEELCSIAKKECKTLDENAPSSIKFYNLQSGNFQGFDLIRKNELTFGEVDFDYGIYFVNHKAPLIDDLIKIILHLKDKKSPKTKLREWLTTLTFNKDLASLQLKRINEIADEKWKKEFNGLIKKFDEKLSLDNLIVDGKTPVFDFIQIISNCDLKVKNGNRI